jgi:hypothetical protein
MPSIRVQNMGGIAPRISRRLLPLNAATLAENCKLWSGEVHAFRSPRVDDSVLKAGFVETIYNLNGYWLSWNTDVDVVRGFIPGDTTGRIYFTGDGAPKITNVALATATPPYPTQAYQLGVAAPTVAPSVALGAGGVGTALLRYYIYTFVTAFDEEGPFSPVSLGLNTLDTQQVFVSGFSTPTSQNVNRIRIYRLSTGTAGSEYLFVDEIPVGQLSYVDTVAELELEESAVSQNWFPPPVNMVGLVAHPNGFLAGFVGNQLYISESYQGHAFPPAYVKVFDYPVVALGVYGNTIVVATAGYVYLVSGIDPRNLTVDKLPDPYPCVSKRSMASGDRGVIYASNDGLVSVGYGGLQVISRDVLTRDDWQLWNPRSMHGVIFDGRYTGFYPQDQGEDYSLVDPRGAGFIFDYNDRATGVDQRDKLTTLNFYTTAVYASPDTTMYYVRRQDRTNTLLEWEAGDGYLKYRWRSKAFVAPYLTTFAAAKVVGQFARRGRPANGRAVVFELVVGDEVKYRREVTSSEPFRLPRLYREVEPWYLYVEGTEFVQEIHVATSMEELKEGGTQ